MIDRRAYDIDTGPSAKGRKPYRLGYQCTACRSVTLTYRGARATECSECAGVEFDAAPVRVHAGNRGAHA